jgi:hypothetical protein
MIKKKRMIILIYLFVVQTDISSCEQIVNDTQCRLEVELEGGCTWIYQKNDSSTNGICVEKNTSDYECLYIQKESQCSNGGGIDVLSGTCEMYGGSCKIRCSNITDEYTCRDTRSDDCFWILGDTSSSVNSYCINKV